MESETFLSLKEMENAFAIWTCPSCGNNTPWSYIELATRGNPVCPCGEDMELEEVGG